MNPLRVSTLASAVDDGKAVAKHTDGVLNNWWEYALNYNDHPEAL